MSRPRLSPSFRRLFRSVDGRSLDGIIHRSTKYAGADAFVLFCENEQCIDIDALEDEASLLRLASVSYL